MRKYSLEEEGEIEGIIEKEAVRSEVPCNYQANDPVEEHLCRQEFSKGMNLLSSQTHCQELPEHTIVSRIITPTAENLLCAGFINWLRLEEYSCSHNIVIEELDVSLICQYSFCQAVNPARTEQCSKICLVEQELLEQELMCACGQEVDPENRIVSDLQLKELLKQVRGLYGEKVKTIRVDCVNNCIKIV